MSERAPAPNRLPAPVAYVIVALAIAFELCVLWLMVHPQVPADYRAYYIDHTTTCLNQPVSGDYELGTTVSFRMEGQEQAKQLRVCGWEGPAGNGTHSVGTSSRLRFALPAGVSGPLFLRLELVAVGAEGHPSQRVEIVANGTVLTTVTARPDLSMSLNLPVPDAVVAGDSRTLEVTLNYPDAIRMSPTDSDTRLRSIKLQFASLSAAEQPL